MLFPFFENFIYRQSIKTTSNLSEIFFSFIFAKQLNNCSYMIMKTDKKIGESGKTCINTDKVRSVKKKMKPEQFFQYLAETFRAMSDPTRTKIIFALCMENELCVSDIATIIGASNSVVSHQLRTLRNMKLVKYNKVGKIIYYSLDDIHINNLFEEGFRHVEEK